MGETQGQSEGIERPKLLTSGAVLPHDNATSHGVTSLLDRYECETLDNPPYLSGINPSDFGLFPKLKVYMRRIRSKNKEELEYALFKLFLCDVCLFDWVLRRTDTV
jgi:hypothetical protein